jgi:hypothetical protein
VGFIDTYGNRETVVYVQNNRYSGSGSSSSIDATFVTGSMRYNDGGGISSYLPPRAGSIVGNSDSDIEAAHISGNIGVSLNPLRENFIRAEYISKLSPPPENLGIDINLFWDAWYETWGSRIKLMDGTE